MRRLGPLVVIAAVVIAACSGGSTPSPGASSPPASPSAPASGSGSPAAPSGEAIKLGLIDMLSGANAQIGKDTQEGAQIGVDEVNASGGILGRPVELATMDEAPNTAAAVNALRTFNSQGVTFTLGLTSSADALAMVPVAAQIGSIIVGSHPATTALTTTSYDPHFVRIAASDAMATKSMAEFAHQNFPGITTWNVMGYDYVTGHDQWQGFLDNLTALGQQYTKGKEVFFPFTAVSSLTSYISSMVSALPADSASNQGLYIASFGAGTFNLIKQGIPYQLMSKFKAVLGVAGGGFLEQAAQLGKDTPDIYSEYDYYYKAYDTPENQKFVADYQAKYGRVPGSWALHGYMSVLAYQAAINKAGSTDLQKVISAFDDLTFKAPQGDVTIRAGDHQATVNVVMRHFVPDPSVPEGFQVKDFTVIKAADILPAVSH
jgi:branched-chain amino acid transport system substrate-binding protein